MNLLFSQPVEYSLLLRQTSHMEDNLWNLSNMITGFSIAQNIAFLYALGKDLHNLQALEGRQKTALACLIVVFSSFYFAALLLICKLAKQLPSDYKIVWDLVTYGRCTAVVLFALLAGFGLFAPEAFLKLGKKPKDPNKLCVPENEAAPSP